MTMPVPPASPPEHWENVYRSKPRDTVSWFRPHLECSLDWIQAALPDRRARLIDVGGGASTLPDDLLAQGYENLTVLDLSEAALAVSRQRLGAAAARVSWRQGDIGEVMLEPHSIDLWHDRAVFHFFTDDTGRQAYLRQLARALKPGGHLILATFAPDGPARCSGLPVQRYDAPALQQLLGADYLLQRHTVEAHETPGGSVQPFTYCLFQRAG
ncbi:class I SAM-dependent methyltransferase [Tahibacter harae]|uniref:Class I SAM-dependent methyltransferase n=1 Tax=Tahibacter harae TaxID=2963937 RepID=A0ABT1QUX1_9GAMM|nr:class I SAM-dependent methyltransferase [Tahibacter harae]MCQ4166084.1 class I SAM-dependent methyltransferase [Tahibacter harae]